MTESRATRWIRWFALGQLLIVSLTLWASLAFAQSQETLNERFQQKSEDNARRVLELESQKADSRLRVLESDMYEVKVLSRSVTGAVILQLLMAGLSIKRRSER